MVENRLGGNGVTGHGVLAKAASDGYTIGLRGAKSQPTQYAFGTLGLATVPHLAAELLQQEAGKSKQAKSSLLQCLRANAQRNYRMY